MTSLVAQTVKASAYNAGDLGSIPQSGRSSGEGNGNPLQYSCLENPTDGGAWWAAVHGVTKSQTRLSDFTSFLPSFLMAGSKEELKGLFLNMKEESEKAGLKLNIQKTKIMAFGPITSWEIDEEQ